MSDKNKTQSGDYREEMEELARIFKEELDKAVQDSEESAEVQNIDELKVEGYNPREVSLDGGEREYTQEELCECCGERPRGTDKNPDSPFCSECEKILEKYPYDWKGITVFAASIFIVIASVICFAVNMPIFSYTIEGEQAYNDQKLLTAMIKYNKAETLISEEDEGKYFNLYEKRIFNEYALLNMDGVVSDVNEYFPESVLKLPMFNTVNDMNLKIKGIQVSVMAINDKLSKFEDISEKNYDEVIKVLDGLSGETLYYDGDNYYTKEDAEAEELDGTEEMYICDEGWINMYKYSVAQYTGKDDKTIAEYLSKAAESSEYLSVLVNPLLASTYVGIGEYDKAEALAEEIKEQNAEGSDYYMIKSMLSRYRDKDYNEGVNFCLKGLDMLSKIPEGSELIASYGYILSMQKTLNYIMLKDYEKAYKSAEECYAYQSESYSISVQVRDLYAMLALETGDKDTFKQLEEEIEQYGDESSAFSSDVENYRDGKVTLQELAMNGGYDLI